MHDVSLDTLEEVIEYYSDPYMFVETQINMDPIMIVPSRLTYQEKEDLVNFPYSLMDETIYKQR